MAVGSQTSRTWRHRRKRRGNRFQRILLSVRELPLCPEPVSANYNGGCLKEAPKNGVFLGPRVRPSARRRSQGRKTHSGRSSGSAPVRRRPALRVSHCRYARLVRRWPTPAVCTSCDDDKTQSLLECFLPFVPSLSRQMIAFLCKDIERRNKKRAVLAPCLGAAGVANPPPLDQLRNGIVRPLCSGDRSQNGTPGAADTGLPAETPLCSTLPLCLSRDKRSDQIFNKRQNRIANTQKRQKRREALKPRTL